MRVHKECAPVQSEQGVLDIREVQEQNVLGAPAQCTQGGHSDCEVPGINLEYALVQGGEGVLGEYEVPGAHVEGIPVQREPLNPTDNSIEQFSLKRTPTSYGSPTEYTGAGREPTEFQKIRKLRLSQAIKVR